MMMMFDNDKEDTSIRRWGCNLRQTPLIFVHIGKSGGGMVRARFAASALNFSKDQNWRKPEGAYYPIFEGRKGEDAVKGYFCNSGHANYKPRTYKYRSTLLCTETYHMDRFILTHIYYSHWSEIIQMA